MAIPDLDFKHHASPDGWYGTAVYDKNWAYRYMVSYVSRAAGETMTWIMLNPSTGSHDRMDPTLRRCWGYARDWGYIGMSVINLYALRATNPQDLRHHHDPIGPDNDEVIDKHLNLQARAHGKDHLVVCGWGGSTPRRTDRPREVWDRITAAGHTLTSLGTTASGQPAHPLYLRRSLTPKQPEYPPRTHKTTLMLEQTSRKLGRMV